MNNLFKITLLTACLMAPSMQYAMEMEGDYLPVSGMESTPIIEETDQDDEYLAVSFDTKAYKDFLYKLNNNYIDKLDDQTADFFRFCRMLENIPKVKACGFNLPKLEKTAILYHDTGLIPRLNDDCLKIVRSQGKDVLIGRKNIDAFFRNKGKLIFVEEKNKWEKNLLRMYANTPLIALAGDVKTSQQLSSNKKDSEEFEWDNPEWHDD